MEENARECLLSLVTHSDMLAYSVLPDLMGLVMQSGMSKKKKRFLKHILLRCVTLTKLETEP